MTEEQVYERPRDANWENIVLVSSDARKEWKLPENTKADLLTALWGVYVEINCIGDV